MCTRNNNFSNRDQKGVIRVVGGTPAPRPVIPVFNPFALQGSGVTTEFQQPENMNEVDNSNTGDGELIGCDASVIPVSKLVMLLAAALIILF